MEKVRFQPSTLIAFYSQRCSDSACRENVSTETNFTVKSLLPLRESTTSKAEERSEENDGLPHSLQDTQSTTSNVLILHNKHKIREHNLTQLRIILKRLKQQQNNEWYDPIDDAIIRSSLIFTGTGNIVYDDDVECQRHRTERDVGWDRILRQGQYGGGGGGLVLSKSLWNSFTAYVIISRLEIVSSRRRCWNVNIIYQLPCRRWLFVRSCFTRSKFRISRTTCSYLDRVVRFVVRHRQ